MFLSVSIFRIWNAGQRFVTGYEPNFSIFMPIIMAKCEPSATTLRSASAKALSVLMLLVKRKITAAQWINFQGNGLL